MVDDWLCFTFTSFNFDLQADITMRFYIAMELVMELASAMNIIFSSNESIRPSPSGSH